MTTVRSKHDPHGVIWHVFKEGQPHLQGGSRVVSIQLGITQDHLRQLAHRKQGYKGVYSIKRKES